MPGCVFVGVDLTDLIILSFSSPWVFWADLDIRFAEGDKVGAHKGCLPPFCAMCYGWTTGRLSHSVVKQCGSWPRLWFNK